MKEKILDTLWTIVIISFFLAVIVAFFVGLFIAFDTELYMFARIIGGFMSFYIVFSFIILCLA